MNISRIALAAAILTAGLSFGHTANAKNSCSAEVYGDDNDVEMTCTNVDAAAVAREILKQSRQERVNRRETVLICTDGFAQRLIVNPALEVNAWNRCLAAPYRMGWVELRYR